MQILRLKEVLAEKNIKSKKLAELVSVTEASISNLVKGDSLPRKDLLIAIAKALDVDVRDLFISTKESVSERIFIQNEDGSFKPIGEIEVRH
ncbi:DNA-binding XRE family transcriptional regulator [Chryseobacterium sp. 52]|uniref:helix-turn-helix domain-containing protein n=1 Tax=Chryseobacterium sp. 52 TaxID=2035213 RepID=UPI000C17AEDF|nr:helix-turn-helix transcriptional regulator [Chryseobacterium sp. 52]PIF44281.1 DNA-binding XRE family transcriptional regulator [Chryseobacterium sp. 52]